MSEAEVERGDRAARWGWRVAAVAVPALVLFFHRAAARPGMAFSGSDLRYFFYGVREAVQAALRSGTLPWWQRGFHLGYPLVADPQAAVFAPTTWLTLPWDGPRSLTLATLLHLCIAGWGMLAWMRLRGLRPASGLVAAVAFALGAKQTVHLIHWNFAATVAFWPWMLAGLEGFAERRRSRYVLLAAVATALAWLGGSPQMAFFGSVVAGLYALLVARGLWRESKGDAAWAVAAVPLGFAMAAVIVLPAMELSAWGPRAAGVDYAFTNSWKWPDAWGLALLVLPHAYGDGRWGLNFWEATGYVGIPVMALAAAASPRRRGVVLLAVLAVVGVWLSLGDAAPLGLHGILYRLLPGYGSFRVPPRGMMVTLLAMAALAAEGLEALRRDPRPARLARPLAVLLVVAALALVLPRLPRFPFDPKATAGTAWFALLVAGLGVAWLAAFWRGLRGWVAGAAIVALSFYEPWFLFSRFNDVSKSDEERPALQDFGKFVPHAPEPRRVAVVAKWGASINAPLRNGWEGTMGYGPMSIQRVRELLEGTWQDRIVPLRLIEKDATFPSARPSSALWPLLSTPLVIADRPMPGLKDFFLGMREWENPLVGFRAPALPRVFWTGSYEIAEDGKVTEPLLRAAAGDRAVLPEAPAGLVPGPPEGPVAATDVKVEGRTLEATVTAPRDGLAVVLDPFYPGWTATLDGKPAPILRADYAFQAVPVPAGRHALRLVYHPRWVALGAVVSLGTLLVVVAALALRTRRRRVAGDPARA